MFEALVLYLLLFYPIDRVFVPPGKSWNSFCKFFRAWKVLENDFGRGKSWKFKLAVLESPGICWDVDAIAMMWMRMQKYSSLRA